MENINYRALRRYLLAELGLKYNDNQEAELLSKLHPAASEFGFQTTADFIEWMLAHSLDGDQLKTLASFLTVGETYFFREQKALAYLEHEYLPKLIKRNSDKRSIKIWSAGCSSGEEAYTLAMILSRAIPDLENWDIQIIGSDINRESLKKARRGTYSKWSFRGMPKAEISKYFGQLNENDYQLNPSIKKLVTFNSINLNKDIFPNVGLIHSFDIVLCRNVMIYFSREVIKRVAQKIYNSLNEGGVLLVSPVEVSHMLETPFQRIASYGASVFVKSSEKLKIQEKPRPSKEVFEPKKIIELYKERQAPVPVQKSRKALPKAIIQEKTIDIAFDKVMDLYKSGNSIDAESLSVKALEFSPANAEDFYLLLSRLRADAGKLEEAEDFCGLALKKNKLNREAHYLLSSILYEQGKTNEAVRSLNNLLFLDPDYVLGHFLLGNIALQNKDSGVYKKHFANALRSLKKCDENELIDELLGLTAGKLEEIISAID